MTGPAENAGGQPRRPVRRALAYLLVLGAGVFAAWQIRTFWIGSRGPTASRPVGVCRPSTVRTQTAWRVPSKPTEMTAEALAASGLGPLVGHPGQLCPPDGAEAAWAFQQRTPGRVDELAQYHYSGQAADAVDYYQRSLTERGFRLTWDRTDAGGRRHLQFHKGLFMANLTLRRPRPQAKLVVLTLIVSRPATPASADE